MEPVNFKAVADQIDAFDAEAAGLSDTRKEYWADIRDKISPEDVKALKAAIKIRRARRRDPDGLEQHDSRVADMLLAIDGLPAFENLRQEGGDGSGVSNDQPTARGPVAATETPANGHSEKTASNARTPASRETVDLETGEVGDIPACLDRRPKLVAAQ